MRSTVSARLVKGSLLILCISLLQNTTCLATELIADEQTDEQIAQTHNAKPVAALPKSNSIDSQALAQFSSILATSGISYTQDKDNIIVNVKKDKALAAIPEVQSMGGIDPSLTDQEIKTHPINLVTQVGLFYTIAIVQYIYLIPLTNTIHVSVNLLDVKDGNEVSNPLATFGFTRKLNSKINYDKLTPENLPQEALDFHYSDWYNEHKETLASKDI
ncbi:MAG: hypothetical protein P4M12_06550 [Gammaproteobacteria bacterium]|nr:hypothetical protein [Gammaproteobacteria bacterium]